MLNDVKCLFSFFRRPWDGFWWFALHQHSVSLKVSTFLPWAPRLHQQLFSWQESQSCLSSVSVLDMFGCCIAAMDIWNHPVSIFLLQMKHPEATFCPDVPVAFGRFHPWYRSETREMWLCSACADAIRKALWLFALPCMEKELIVIAFARQNDPPDLTSQVKNPRNTAVFLDLTWQAKIPCTSASRY